MPTTEWHDGNELSIKREGMRSQNPRKQNLLTVAFTENYEAREVQLRVGANRLLNIFVCLVGCFRQCDCLDFCVPFRVGRLIDESKVTNVARINTRQNAWGVT